MIDFEFKTRRLEVRPIDEEDYGACMRTRAISVLSVQERGGQALAVSACEKAGFKRMVEHRLDEMLEDRAYHFGIFIAASREFAGEVMLFDVLRSNRQMASVGAVIHSAYRRHGYASEALKGLLRYGFRTLKLHRIEGQARPDNQVSIHMCKSVGLREEGISAGRFKEGGRWFDALILATTRI